VNETGQTTPDGGRDRIVKAANLKIEPAGQQVILCLAEEAMAAQLAAAVAQSGRRCTFLACREPDELVELLQRESPSLIVIDDGILRGVILEDMLLHLTESVPVAVMAAPERQADFARWVSQDDVEFIAKTGNFVPLAAGVIVRQLRWTERAQTILGLRWSKMPPDFASILRHEINNPLTGILGNAEMLLVHHREALPLAGIQRLETIVDLAVRLRETTRRLGDAWEREHASARSA
jgi:signal transduction histidine kinase